MAVAVVAATAAAGLLAVGTAQAAPSVQTLVSDPFAAATTSSPIIALGSKPGFPCLTASTDPTATPVPGCAGTPDPVGAGVLRLTDVENNLASGIIYDSSFPLVKGVVATFSLYQWGGTGADGVSFDLAVAPPTPTALGQSGGGLGYTNTYGAPNADGLAGGYLGVGFDTYGTYGTQSPGCPQGLQRYTSSIAVRGPGNKQTGYCLIGTAPANLRATARTQAKRGVKITIDPTTMKYTVAMDPTGGTTYSPYLTGSLPTSYYDPTTGASVAGLPKRLTFVFAGSTGQSTDNHDIGDVNVSTLTGAVPVLTLAKTDDQGGQVRRGAAFTYTLTPAVSADGGSEDAPSSVRVTDPMPTGVTITAIPTGSNWNCAGSTATTASCIYTGTTSIPAGTALPPITVPAQLSSTVALGSTVTNSATVLSDDAAAPAAGTDTITVAPTPPTVTADPTDQFVTSSGTATFSASAAGDPAPSVQWQSSGDGATWTDVPGATGDTLTVPAVTVAADDGRRYRAVYSNGGGSATTQPATLHVGKGSSTTTAMTLAGDAVVGVERRYVATVAADPASIAVSGAVTFTDGGSAIPSCSAVPVSSGSATCSVTWPAAGSHSITAAYGGSTELVASSSAPLVDTIRPVTTSTAITAAPSSAVVGQPVTYTVTVAEQAPGTAPLDGTVALSEGGVLVPGCTALVLDAQGTATCSTTYAAPGDHSVVADYSGGPATAASTAAPASVTVGKGSTGTAVSATPSTSSFGQAVTFTATVAPIAPAAGPITGSVTFLDGTTTLGTATVTGVDGSYVATSTTSTLSAGTHQITAVYSGDGSFVGSTSAPTTLTVNRPATTLTAAPYVKIAPLTLRLSPSATLTAGGLPLAGRAIRFTVGGSTICTATTGANGTASCTGSLAVTLQVALSLGYTATFAGDADYLGSTARGALLLL